MLAQALANIHRDPFWWRTIGIGGALMLTGIGYPLAMGLVVEYMENCRRGFATPLPPWYDWGTRYLIGLFALLIDFLFYVLPLLMLGLLMLCIGISFVVANLGETMLITLFSVIGVSAGLLWIVLWLAGISPTARMLYIREGRIEEALGNAPIQLVFSSKTRSRMWQTRMATLPVYIPCLVVGGILFVLVRVTFPFQTIAIVALLWLFFSALLYAHAVTGQIYAQLARELL